jgi:hypothetical protein
MLISHLKRSIPGYPGISRDMVGYPGISRDLRDHEIRSSLEEFFVCL